MNAITRTTALAAACSMFLAAANAQPDAAPACHAGAKKVAAKVDRAHPSATTIPDIEVTTQNGEKVNFYRDLIKGKVVAVNFVFTTCTTVCPPMGALFANLQKQNEERLGKDIHLVSVSIDPVVDTPQRLKAWGAKFGARDGWTLVTGDKQDITRLLKAMNVYVANFQDHQAVTLLGNETTGEWKRSYGFTSAAKLTAMLDDISAGQRGGR